MKFYMQTDSIREQLFVKKLCQIQPFETGQQNELKSHSPSFYLYIPVMSRNKSIYHFS